MMKTEITTEKINALLANIYGQERWQESLKGWNPLSQKRYLEKIKHYLEKGECIEIGNAYIDGQADAAIMDIMRHEGADITTIKEVMNGK